MEQGWRKKCTHYDDEGENEQKIGTASASARPADGRRFAVPPGRKGERRTASDDVVVSRFAHLRQIGDRVAIQVFADDLVESAPKGQDPALRHPLAGRVQAGDRRKGALRQAKDPAHRELIWAPTSAPVI